MIAALLSDIQGLFQAAILGMALGCAMALWDFHRLGDKF